MGRYLLWVLCDDDLENYGLSCRGSELYVPPLNIWVSLLKLSRDDWVGRPPDEAGGHRDVGRRPDEAGSTDRGA